MLLMRVLRSVTAAAALAVLLVLPAHAGGHEGHRAQRGCACGQQAAAEPRLFYVPQPYYIVDQGPSYEPPIGARLARRPYLGRYERSDPAVGFGWPVQRTHWRGAADRRFLRHRYGWNQHHKFHR